MAGQHGADVAGGDEAGALALLLFEADLGDFLADVGVDIFAGEEVHGPARRSVRLYAGLHIERGLLEAEVAEDGGTGLQGALAAELKQPLFVQVGLIADLDMGVGRECGKGVLAVAQDDGVFVPLVLEEVADALFFPQALDEGEGLS